MNAIPSRIWLQFLACWALVCILDSTWIRAEPVFDNTHHYNTTWYSSTLELGDDAILSGTARTITEFYLEYYGEFSSTGQETARIRFYANDGPGMSPETVLYESDPMPIYPGYNLLVLRDLSVAVSDAFIWTVQFAGVSGAYKSRAGLLFYGPPALGQSYKDCWLKQQGKWGTVMFTTAGVAANFSVRIIAQPDPPVALSTRILQPSGRHMLTVTGPNFSSAVLWGSDDNTNWSLLSSFNFVGEPVSMIDPQDVPGKERFYKAEPASEPVLHLKSLLRTNATGKSERVVRITGQPGRSFDLENGYDLANWFPMLETYVLTSGVYEAVSPPGSQLPIRFYRAQWAPDSPIGFGIPSILPDGRVRLLGAGPPGRGCVLQTSTDLKLWTSVNTNYFSFTTSSYVLILPAPANAGPLFVRGMTWP